MKKQIKRAYASLPVVPDDGLVRYIRQAQSFPILAASEEYRYASSFAKNRDKSSAEKLVSSHLRLVVSMAYELHNYGIPLGELIQAGNVGLMEALSKFDPEKGFRFSTYATFWIKAEMYNIILANWSMVKIGSGAAQKKVFFNLARTKRALGIMENSLSGEQAKLIADKLEVSESDVINMSERMHARDVSLNANKYEDGAEMIDYVEDKSKPVAQELEEMEERARGRELLRKHLLALPERMREIITLRRLTEPAKTLEELSEKYGISRERVRQIEESAFEKLRNAILKEEGRGKKEEKDEE